LLDIPFSFTAHAYDATLIRALLKEKVRRAVSIITCTRMNQRFLSAMVPEAAGKIRVNYHGIALDQFTPNGTQQSPRQGPLHILSCGSLYPRKGFPDLLEACRLLRHQGHTFQCTIIGQGPMRRRLERFIRKHRLSACVHLAGALPQQQVIQAYRTADVFVLPCVTDYLGWDELFTEPIRLLEVGLAIPFRPITDGIPNVLAEAMAMGIPVIATTIAGIPELIEDGVHGLLVPEKTPRALAHAMARLLRDPETRRQLAERGSERVRQVFDRSQNIQELVEMLTTLTPPAR
jgi:glycosyltransferase involved in cell wall biosynthesis